MRIIIIYIFLCASTVGAFAQKKANNSHKKQAKYTLSIVDNCMIHLDSVVSEEAKKAIFKFDEMMSMVSPTMACLQKYITKKWDFEAQCPNCTSLKEYLLQHKYNEAGQMAEDIAVAYWVHLKFPKMSGSIETYISKKSKFLPPGVNHGDLNCDFIKR
jgi:hypothetical protein